eukprot:c21568_g1_i1.p1 GENE.c21568_g1_i1~~c21568_g1_i1.p1  ORF type:complete len:1118 (+),score=308.18 c21568_g1_i1:63-3416(+)
MNPFFLRVHIGEDKKEEDTEINGEDRKKRKKRLSERQMSQSEGEEEEEEEDDDDETNSLSPSLILSRKAISNLFSTEKGGKPVPLFPRPKPAIPVPLPPRLINQKTNINIKSKTIRSHWRTIDPRVKQTRNETKMINERFDISTEKSDESSHYFSSHSSLASIQNDDYTILVFRDEVIDNESNWPSDCPITHIDFESDFRCPSKARFAKKALYFWFWLLNISLFEIIASMSEYMSYPVDEKYDEVANVFTFSVASFFGSFYLHFRILYNGLRFRNTATLYLYMILNVFVSILIVIFFLRDLDLVIIASQPNWPDRVVSYPYDSVFPTLFRTALLLLWVFTLIILIYFTLGAYYWATLETIREIELIEEELERQSKEWSFIDFIFIVKDVIIDCFKKRERYDYTKLVEEPPLNEVRPEAGWKCLLCLNSNAYIPGSIILSPSFAQFYSDHHIFGKFISRQWRVDKISEILQIGRILTIKNKQGESKIYFPTEVLCSKFMNELWEIWFVWFSDESEEIIGDIETGQVHDDSMLNFQKAYRYLKVKSWFDKDEFWHVHNRNSNDEDGDEDDSENEINQSEEKFLDSENVFAISAQAIYKIFTSDEWNWLFDGLVMEPYQKNDVIIEIDEPLKAIYYVEDSSIRVQSIDDTVISDIKPGQIIGIAQFLLQVLERSSYLNQNSVNDNQQLKDAILKHNVEFRQDVEFVVNESCCLYSISFSHLMQGLLHKPDLASKLYLWISQILVDRVEEGATKLSKNIENLLMVRAQKLSGPMRRLLDGSELSDQGSRYPDGHFSTIFGLPAGEAVVLRLHCACSYKKKSIGERKFWNGSPRKGCIYVFVFHVCFYAQDFFRFNEFTLTIPFANITKINYTESSFSISTTDFETYTFTGYRDLIFVKMLERMWKDPPVVEAKLTKYLENLFITRVKEQKKQQSPENKKKKTDSLENEKNFDNNDNTRKCSVSHSSPNLMEELFYQKLSVCDKESLFANEQAISLGRNQKVKFDRFSGQSDRGDVGIYLLLKGTIRHQRTMHQGCSIVSFIYSHPGDLVGIECFLTNSTEYYDFVVCTDQAIVKYIKHSLLIDKLEKDPLLQTRFYRELAIALVANPCTMISYENDQFFLY